MISRKSLLTLSILLSLVFHGGLLVVSPKIAIMSSLPSFHEPDKPFRIRLRDDVPPPPPPAEQAPPPGEGKGSLSTQPGSLEDLLKRELERLSPTQSTLEERVEIPQLSERVAAEPIEREHALQPDAAMTYAADTKLIEISEDVARKDIEVARRLVTPTSTRILPENDLPLLTGDIDPLREQMLTISPMPVGGGGAPAGGREGMPGQGNGLSAPPKEPVLDLPLPAPGLPDLLEDKVIARAPLAEAVRKESPYEFMDDLVTITLDTYRAANEKEGYFRVRIAPKDTGALEILPKDVTFVIDASNSILQRKLDLTAAGIKAALRGLHAEDLFNIVIFRDSAVLFRPGPVPATPENKAAADAFLTGLKSFGQTDVYLALDSVLQRAPRPGTPGIIVVATDGRPTTGVRDGRTIINNLTAANVRGNTVFAYGGGQTVNRYLLDLLAYRNRGESFVSPLVDTMDRDLASFFGQLDDPILSGCAANYGGIDQGEVYPKDVPDFYKGHAVTVYGRFDPSRDQEFSMRLTGAAGARKKELIFRADLRKAGKGDAELARNWAFGKVYFLIGEICRVGETPELLTELRDLSRKYKIKTSYDE